MTCLIILIHFFHSQSLIDTIMWKHHNNNMMNMMNGNNSMILYIMSLTNVIGSSHWNHSVSSRGRFSQETASQFQNQRSVLNSSLLLVSLLVSHCVIVFNSVMISFWANEKKGSNVIHIILIIDTLFLKIISMYLNINGMYMIEIIISKTRVKLFNKKRPLNGVFFVCFIYYASFL